MGEVQRTYLPAASHDWVLPLYDPLVKLLGVDAVRRALLDQAAVRPTHRVLDIGCGTGTLATLIKRSYPSVEVVGLDPDLKALARGRRKAHRAAVSVQFDQGFSDDLPYPEASFDRVFSSFMLHHLRAHEREKTLCEVRRVLKPEGSLYILDFVRPEAQENDWLASLIHSSHRLKDNSEARILTLMRQAGFQCSKKVMEGAVLFGSLPVACYQASVPNLATEPDSIGCECGRS